MGLYNFARQFVPQIVSGTKRQTIRAKRRTRETPGNTLHLYTGLRSRATRLIARVICTRVQRIEIANDGGIRIDGKTLSRTECEQLARRDGFASLVDMMAYFDKTGLPFSGDLIHWNP